MIPSHSQTKCRGGCCINIENSQTDLQTDSECPRYSHSISKNTYFTIHLKLKRKYVVLDSFNNTKDVRHSKIQMPGFGSVGAKVILHGHDGTFNIRILKVLKVGKQNQTLKFNSIRVFNIAQSIHSSLSPFKKIFRHRVKYLYLLSFLKWYFLFFWFSFISTTKTQFFFQFLFLQCKLTSLYSYA